MREAKRESTTCIYLFAGIALAGVLTSDSGWPSDTDPASAIVPASPRQNLPLMLQKTSAARAPLNLLLTRAELQAIIRRYEARTGENLTAPIDEDEVLVTAQGEQAPMRDLSQDVLGGIAAPFWAIAHPTQAWRIFVPIPPKGDRKDSERPVPDPR